MPTRTIRPSRIVTLALLAGGSATAAAPLDEDVGLGSVIGEMILRGDCRMVIVGDSISVKNQDDFQRSSMYWGVLRSWQPERWVGVVTPSNNQYPTVETLLPTIETAEVIPRNLQSKPPGNRVFSYGYEGFAPAAAVDVLFDRGVDVPDFRRVLEHGLVDGGAWKDPDWFRNAPLEARVIHLRTPETIPSLMMLSERVGVGEVASPIEDRSGPPAVVGWDAPSIPAGFGDVGLRVVTAGQYDESASLHHFIWLGTRVWIPGASGFQLDSYAVGGARLADWLSSGPFASDEHLRQHMELTGGPNLFMIQLGANDLLFPSVWKDDYEALIDRLDAVCAQVGVEPRFVLVPPYGTEQSVQHADALRAAEFAYEIALDGTVRVDESRIGFVNLPALLDGPIDQSLLTDTIHPTAAGADFLARKIWLRVTGTPSFDGCLADLTHSSDPVNYDFGVPDGVIDAEDYNYFLDGFVARDPAIADLTGSSDPTDPRYGTPDGIIDAEDYNYFLDGFVARDLSIADLTGSDDRISDGFGVPDGVLDLEDYFFFLDRFVEGDPRVDYTGSNDPLDPRFGSPDGVVDSADVFYFFDLFRAGCR